MRRMKLNHEQFVVIFMAAFVVTVGTGYFWYMESIEERGFRYRTLNSTNGYYWIEITDGGLKRLENIEFEVVDDNGLTVAVQDPKGQTIRLEGTLNDIKMDWDEWREAYRQTEWPDAVPDQPHVGLWFHADYPSGENNITLFIL